MKKIFNILLNDTPTNWVVCYNQNAFPQMDRLIELHDSVVFYLILILFAVGWVLLCMLINFLKPARLPEYEYHYIEMQWKIVIFSVFIIFLYLGCQTPLLNAGEWVHETSGFLNSEFVEGMNSNGESSNFPVNSQVPVNSHIPENNQVPENSQVPVNSHIPENNQVPVNNQVLVNSQVPLNSEVPVSTYNFNPFSFVYNSIVPEPEALANHIHSTPLSIQTSENPFLGLHTVNRIDVPSNLRSLNEITTIQQGREIINLSLNANYPVSPILNSGTNISGLPVGYGSIGPRQAIPAFSLPNVPSLYNTSMVEYSPNVPSLYNTSMVESSLNIPFFPSSDIIPYNTNVLVSEASEGIMDTQYISDPTGLIPVAPNIQDVFGTYLPDTGLSNNNLMSNYISPVHNSALDGLEWNESFQLTTDLALTAQTHEFGQVHGNSNLLEGISRENPITINDFESTQVHANYDLLGGSRENPIIVNDFQSTQVHGNSNLLEGISRESSIMFNDFEATQLPLAQIPVNAYIGQELLIMRTDWEKKVLNLLVNSTNLTLYDLNFLNYIDLEGIDSFLNLSSYNKEGYLALCQNIDPTKELQYYLIPVGDLIEGVEDRGFSTIYRLAENSTFLNNVTQAEIYIRNYDIKSAMYIKSNTGLNLLYIFQKEIPVGHVNRFIYVKVSDVFLIYDPKVHYNLQLYLQCGSNYYTLNGFISPNGNWKSNGDRLYIHHLNSSKVYLYNVRSPKSEYYSKLIEVTNYYDYYNSSLANREFNWIKKTKSFIP